MAIQDRVFLGGQYPDRAYEVRREQAFIVAVDCGEAGGTCFCASTGTGPKAEAGFDLALTELIENGRHIFWWKSAAPPAPISSRTCRRGRPPKPRSPPPQRLSTEPEKGWAARSTPTGSRNCFRPTPTTRAGTRWRNVASPAAIARWSARPASARRSRTHRPHRRQCGTRAPLGFVLHPGFLLSPWRQRAVVDALALPAMDDPQARALVSTSSAPRAASAAAAASPGALSASTSPRRRRRSGLRRRERGRWRDLKELSSPTRSSPASAPSSAARLRLRPQSALCRRRLSVPGGGAGERVLPDPPWCGGARNLRARAAADHHRDLARG